MRYLSDGFSGRRDGEGDNGTSRCSQDISSFSTDTTSHERVRERLFVKVKAKRMLLPSKVACFNFTPFISTCEFHLGAVGKASHFSQNLHSKVDFPAFNNR